jgi:shikimate dehydrogenase
MRKAAVIGWPISHSRSPLIHGYWLQQYGIEGSYERRPVQPEDLPAFIDSLRRGDLAGCNVTVPHKEAVLKLVDDADATARAIGAANTLWMEGGRLKATNTDAHGFLANLEAAHPDWRDPPGIPLVVGAGGAARAVIHALRRAGCKNILLTNRTRARADDLAGYFGDAVEALDWDRRRDGVADCSLLINTTTQGMAGQDALDVPVESLNPDSIVYDLVYVPLETPLLARAQRQGNRTLGGLGMLLHQAVVGFEHWFGTRPAVTTELHDLVVADLTRH